MHYSGTQQAVQSSNLHNEDWYTATFLYGCFLILYLEIAIKKLATAAGPKCSSITKARWSSQRKTFKRVQITMAKSGPCITKGCMICESNGRNRPPIDVLTCRT